jgi:Amt family ammonium transporter
MTSTPYNCSAVTPASAKDMCLAFSEQLAALRSLQTATSADINSFFLIWASVLVIFMHSGFAMLTACAVRTKNVRNILLSTTLDMSVCALAWFLCGFGFAFGADNGDGFIGTTYFVGLDVGAMTYNASVSQAGGGTTFSFWIFEYAFAATSATIVAGAVAERARFETYFIYSLMLSAFTYPVVVHWVWGGGFLTLGNPRAVLGLGSLDFAGDGPVHMIGGVAGMVASKIMGPRLGRFDPESGEPLPIPGHSSALVNLGVFILWIGWFGFNVGSTVVLTPGGGVVASRTAVNTILCSAAAVISTVFFAYLVKKPRMFDFNMAMNGALAGLVSITGSCAAVEMWAAICIGLVGGVVYVGASDFVLRVLRIDDPLDATAIHVFGAMWGLLAGGAFANPALIQQLGGFAHMGPGGFLYPGAGGALLACQLVEICVVLVWTLLIMAPLFLVLNHFEILRVPPEIEEDGLDSSHHGGQVRVAAVAGWGGLTC